MHNRKAITSEPIHELLAGRRSPRAFDRNRPVARHQLISLLEAARWAPSCFGDQPWRFIVADRLEDESAWQALFACLAEKNRLWAVHAPLLILACAATEFRQSGKPNRWAEYDTGAASLSICLQAHAMGLIAHQMGGFDHQQIKHACDLPEQVVPMAVIAIGYQAGIDVLDELFHDMEKGDRQRLPLSDNFFAGRWGNPVVE